MARAWQMAAVLALVGASAQAQPAPPPESATDTAAEPVTEPERVSEPVTEPEPATEPVTEPEPATEPAPVTVTPDTSNPGTSAPEEARGHAREPDVESEDVLLAVPRALLFLPTFVLDVAFFPLREAMKLNDRHRIFHRVKEWLYFDDAHTQGWAPSLRIVGSQGVSVGASVFDNDLLDHEEELRASARYGGRYTQFYELAFEADALAGSPVWTEARLRYESSPELLFGGIGMIERDAVGDVVEPRQSNRPGFFAQERGLALLRGGYGARSAEGLVKLGGSVITNHRLFRTNDGDRRSIEDVYDTALLPGYDDGVTTLELTLNLIADYRRTPGLDSSGPYLELFWGGVPELDGYHYAHYGGEVAYTLDLFRGTRLLSLRTALEAVEADDDTVPFSDLPRLGGPHRLRGYRLDRYRDKRAALASVEYHYPIHRNMLGQLFVDAGRVSHGFGDLYDLQEWKVGYGGGIIFGDQQGIVFRLDISYGEDLLVFLSGELPGAFDGRSSQL